MVKYEIEIALCVYYIVYGEYNWKRIIFFNFNK